MNLNSASRTATDEKRIEEQTREIAQRIRNMVTENDLRKIQVFIAENTKADAIRAIQSGAIIQELNIDTEGFKSDWARIKRALLGILETED